MKIDNLNAVAPWIVKIATETAAEVLYFYLPVISCAPPPAGVSSRTMIPKCRIPRMQLFHFEMARNWWFAELLKGVASPRSSCSRFKNVFVNATAALMSSLRCDVIAPVKLARSYQS